jgi:hypothetical protein
MRILLQGLRAQEFVRTWKWSSVADQYAAEIANADVVPLGADAFIESNGPVTSSKWTSWQVTLSSGEMYDFRVQGAPARFRAGLYALYADVDIQVC